MKKVAVVVTNRTPYGRLRPVIRAIQEHPDLELQLIVGAPVVHHDLGYALRHARPASLLKSLPWYVRARARTLFLGEDAMDERNSLLKTVRADGFPIAARLPLFLEGGKLETMAKSSAAILQNLPDIFNRLKPDIVLVHADRFEMLAVAKTAAFMNIPIAHTQGGDVTGTIDEPVRHAITKLAHLHFPTTEMSQSRLFRMGEDPTTVYMVGCPTIDTLKSIDLSIDDQLFERNGPWFGDKIDLTKPYVLVMQHSVTTEYASAKTSMEETLAAIKDLGMPVLFFWPNYSDAGADGATSAVREFLRAHGLPGFTLFKTLQPDDFYRVLNGAAVAIGNSSSFIREGSYLGTPSVLVGSRQQGRERGENVVEVGYDRRAIVEAARRQLAHGRYASSALYGDGTASQRIANILASEEPAIQKRFHDEP